MIVKYGDYAHQTGENWFRFEYRFAYNRIGRRQAQLNRCTLWGTLIQEDANQTSLLTKIEALEEAYATNYNDLIVYLNDGTTETRHFLINSGTTSGVQVKSITWLDVDPRQERQSGTEHVNKRTYQIVLESQKIVNEHPLVSWEETVIGVGTGGSVFIQKPALTGPPQRQVIQQFSSYQAVQFGRAIGYLASPIPASPIWPGDEHVERRRVEFGAPLNFGPIQSTDFPVSWRYEFESASILSGGPTPF